MRPKNYIAEAEAHVTHLKRSNFAYKQIVEGSVEARELTFAMASFAVQQSIKEGRTFLKDPEMVKVVEQLLGYFYETQNLRECTKGQSDV